MKCTQVKAGIYLPAPGLGQSQEELGPGQGRLRAAHRYGSEEMLRPSLKQTGRRPYRRLRAFCRQAGCALRWVSTTSHEHSCKVAQRPRGRVAAVPAGGGLHGGTGLAHGARAQCMWQPEAWYSEQPSLGWRQAGILGAGPQTSGLEVPPPGQVAELPYRCLGTSFAQPRCPRRGSGRGGRGGREQRFTLWAVPRDPCWDLVPFWTLCVQMQGEPLWTKGSPTSWGATGRHPWAPDPFP